jgi:hypothetical protein
VQVVLPFTAESQNFLSLTAARIVGVEVTYVTNCSAASAVPRQFAPARIGTGHDRSKLLFLIRALDDIPAIRPTNTTLNGNCTQLSTPSRVGLDTVCELSMPASGSIVGQITLTEGSNAQDAPLDFSVHVQ